MASESGNLYLNMTNTMTDGRTDEHRKDSKTTFGQNKFSFYVPFVNTCTLCDTVNVANNAVAHKKVAYCFEILRQLCLIISICVQILPIPSGTLYTTFSVFVPLRK